MFNIIPIEKTNDIRDIDFDNSECFITGLNTISKLISIDNYPIKNKRIAITNILSFLKYVDAQLAAMDDKKIDNKKTVLPIASSVLIEYFSRDSYKDYMNILKSLSILSEVPYEDGVFYEIGQRNKLYRIFNEYCTDELAIVITETDNNIEFVTDGTYNKKYVKTIKGISIDYLGAITDEIANHKAKSTTIQSLRVRLSNLFALNNRRFIFKGFNVDRIYHSLSNISKISRKYISYNGQSFNDVDVKNCQPLLLCYLILESGLELDNNYKYDCEISNVYENFVIPGIRDRAATKIDMYKYIYFKFQPNTEIGRKFKALYPKTFASIEILSKSEKTMASMLQNLEASIMNDIIPAKSDAYYTLFDSIYFTDIEDCISIIKEIKNKFGKYNIKPMMTINGETENDINEEASKIEETSTYIYTRFDYVEYIKANFYSTFSSKQFLMKKELILNELVKSQVRKKSEIKLIIKNNI